MRDKFKLGELVIAVPHNGYGITNNGWLGHFTGIKKYDTITRIVVSEKDHFPINEEAVVPYNENLETVNFPKFTGKVDDSDDFYDR